MEVVLQPKGGINQKKEDRDSKKQGDRKAAEGLGSLGWDILRKMSSGEKNLTQVVEHM